MTLEHPPAKLSALCRLAVADARGLDRTLYEPKWKDWHVPVWDEDALPGHGRVEKCQVCLAGSVIAGTLQCPIEKEYFGDGELGWTDDWDAAIEALDNVRYGNVSVAVHIHMGTDEAYAYRFPKVRHGGFEDWSEFDCHLIYVEEVAQVLEEHGL